MWEAFATVYLRRSLELLDGKECPLTQKYVDLPATFLEGCVEKRRVLAAGVDKILTDSAPYSQDYLLLLASHGCS